MAGEIWEGLLSENLPFVEELYERFLEDEEAVDPKWAEMFRAIDEPDGRAAGRSPFSAHSIFNPTGGNGAPVFELTGNAQRRKQDRVAELVNDYRVRGHLFARLDPLGLNTPPRPDFKLEDYGLDESDLDRHFVAGQLEGTLRDIIEHLEETYCRTIGVEVGHLLEDPEAHDWLVERMEQSRNHPNLSRIEQLRLLTKLTDAEMFEQFLGTKFVGAKRFSLEGGESLIPLLDLLVEKSADRGVEEIIIGMAHRGRLNVMANILDKPFLDIFAEFADQHPEKSLGGGDVKYHLGYSCNRVVSSHTIHLSLTFNPSHLEWVNPVVMGRVRGKQDLYGDRSRTRVVPLLIHGDAAFSGQGVVPELLNMSELLGYYVGGAIHVIVNNQIGFTTGPREGRSSLYPSDVAKMLHVPIFHVNGEDPESVAQVVRLATEFRQEFCRDVLIDLWSYRRHGHNEGDEPAFTQPLMYKEIRNRPTIREKFKEKMRALGKVTEDEVKEIERTRQAKLEEHLQAMRDLGKEHTPFKPPSRTSQMWLPYHGGPDDKVPDVDTSVPRERLKELGLKLCEVPEDFHPHKKIERLLDRRRQMMEGERPIDWGMGEALAFASLLAEGAPIRMSGQDVGRGTFSHRHAVLTDFENGVHFTPLNNLEEEQAHFQIYNSPLNEASVLGFEYGYSRSLPHGLVIWEAQFGDFANTAQVIIDQFIISAEDKWYTLSGLVLQLPHGYEGQGPEHSSARMERWLTMAAEDNVQICNLTSPAQLFHVLRRQVQRPYRKPLVMFSPKSLLRHPGATNTLEELASGSFKRILEDPKVEAGELDPQGVKRVILCSGKVYYDLAEKRDADAIDDAVIIRLEQLYPLRLQELRDVVARYPEAEKIVWVQEEPANNGAWPYLFVLANEEELFAQPFIRVSRAHSASPATGSKGAHKLEQKKLLEAAFSPELDGHFAPFH